MFGNYKVNCEGKRIALVMSGGAVKAACFHVGVCLALQEKGFNFQCGPIEKPLYPKTQPNLIDIYVGSSAGSFIAAYLATGYTIREIIASFAEKKSSKGSLKKLSYSQLFNLKLPHWKAPFQAFAKKRIQHSSSGLEAFLRNYMIINGIASTRGIEKHLSQVLRSNKFNDLAPELFVVATQLNHSRRTIFGKNGVIDKINREDLCDTTDQIKISHAVAASSALPPFFVPYQITHPDGNKLDYFDGEIRKTLSTHIAKDVGADIIIASYTHQPYHYVKEVGSLSQYGMTQIVTQAIYQTIEQKISMNKKTHEQKKEVLEIVNQFFKDNNFPEEKRKTLVSALEEKLAHKPDLKYIFINPMPKNYEMFFGDHFNLSPKVMEAQMKIGFRTAIRVLNQQDFLY